MEFVHQLMVKERVELGCGVQDQPWWGRGAESQLVWGLFLCTQLSRGPPPTLCTPQCEAGRVFGGVFESPLLLGGDGLFA